MKIQVTPSRPLAEPSRVVGFERRHPSRSAGPTPPWGRSRTGVVEAPWGAGSAAACGTDVGRRYRSGRPAERQLLGELALHHRVAADERRGPTAAIAASRPRTAALRPSSAIRQHRRPSSHHGRDQGDFRAGSGSRARPSTPQADRRGTRNSSAASTSPRQSAATVKLRARLSDRVSWADRGGEWARGRRARPRGSRSVRRRGDSVIRWSGQSNARAASAETPWAAIRQASGCTGSPARPRGSVAAMRAE